ncbi:MAG: nucleotide exchange factor GrpE [Bacillota bacterium]
MTKTMNKEKESQDKKVKTEKEQNKADNIQQEKEQNQADNIQQEKEQNDNSQLLEKAQQEAVDYKNHLQRLQAEFDNYRKRTSENAISSRNDGICDVILEIIPAIDNLERGIEAVKDNSAKSGMEIILKQLREILKKFDVCEIKALGESFNPDKHHAIAKEDECDDKESENKVTEVFSKGYQRNTKVLRPAMVKVTK